MWLESQVRLEALSRQMASTLRHDRSCNGILLVEACRSLGLPVNEDGSPGPKWPASDVLLVAVGSRRDCGQRRFCVEQSAEDGTYFVEARTKRGPHEQQEPSPGTTKEQGRFRHARGPDVPPQQQGKVTFADIGTM